MPGYTIDYEAWNKYQNHVGESFFSLLIIPCDDDKQQLIRHKVENSLQENIFFTKNHFGFHQAMIHSLKSFNELRLKMHCDVRVNKFNPYDYDLLPPEKELKIMNSPDFQIDNYIYLSSDHYTQLHYDQLGDHWMKTAGENVNEFLLRISNKIYHDFSYDPENTSIHQNAYLTLETQTGVCQDYAHAFIGIARANKIPCRYVSGYLNQGKGFTGALQMHAWAEAMIPGVGWIGYDPTNNLLRDSNYVKVCHGANYDDCSPIKGVLKTTGSNETTYEVKIVQQ